MANKLGRIPLRSRGKELERIYGAVEKAITKELFSFDIGDYQEMRAIKMQEKIDRLIRMLNRTAIKWVKSSISEAYEESYLISKTRLEILGAKKDIYFNINKHRHSVDEYTDITMNDLIKANQSIKTNVAMYLYLARQASRGLMQIQAFDLRSEEIIAGLLDDAIREGTSRGKLEQLIRIHFKRELYEKKFININGRNYNMIKYSKMVARTRLRHVQSEAVKNACEQFDNDLVEISAHGTVCPICIPYEGNIYSVSGKSSKYPYLDGWPPYHPNCEHSASPTSEAALEVRKWS